VDPATRSINLYPAVATMDNTDTCAESDNHKGADRNQGTLIRDRSADDAYTYLWLPTRTVTPRRSTP